MKKSRKNVVRITIFAIIPLLFAVFYLFSDEGSYMWLSSIILVLTCIPFFLTFERRKPKAREIVLLSTISAIAVFLHLTFSVVMPIQIGTAMIFIAGASLGSECGFIVGCISRFICNMYMGHGPWSPWQMVCWGMIGFAAGVLFADGRERRIRDAVKSTLIYEKDDAAYAHAKKNKGLNGGKDIGSYALVRLLGSVIFFQIVGYIINILFRESLGDYRGMYIYIYGAIGLTCGLMLAKKNFARTPLAMSAVCFIITFVLYGGIMNLSVIMTSGAYSSEMTFSLDSMKAVYISGVPYDLFHGITAGLCVFFMGDNLIRKLERVKIKYGIYT